MAVIYDHFAGVALPAGLSGLPASALKYLPQNMGGSISSTMPSMPAAMPTMRGNVPTSVATMSPDMQPSQPRMPFQRNPQIPPNQQYPQRMPMHLPNTGLPQHRLPPQAPGQQAMGPQGQMPGPTGPSHMPPRGNMPNAHNLTQQPQNMGATSLPSQPGSFQQQLRTADTGHAPNGQLPFSTQNTLPVYQMTNTMPLRTLSLQQPPYNNVTQQPPGQYGPANSPQNQQLNYNSMTVTPSQNPMVKTLPHSNQIAGQSSTMSQSVSNNQMAHPTMTMSGSHPIGHQSNQITQMHSANQGMLHGQQSVACPTSSNAPTSQQWPNQTHLGMNTSLPSSSVQGGNPYLSLPSHSGAPNTQLINSQHMPTAMQSASALHSQVSQQANLAKGGFPLNSHQQAIQQPMARPPAHVLPAMDQGSQNALHGQQYHQSFPTNMPAGGNSRVSSQPQVPSSQNCFISQNSSFSQQSSGQHKQSIPTQADPSTIRPPVSVSHLPSNPASQVQPRPTLPQTQLGQQNQQQQQLRPVVPQTHSQIRHPHRGQYPQQQVPQSFSQQSHNRMPIQPPVNNRQAAPNLLDSNSQNIGTQPLQPFNVTPDNSGRASPASSVHSEQHMPAQQSIQRPMQQPTQQPMHPPIQQPMQQPMHQPLNQSMQQLSSQSSQPPPPQRKALTSKHQAYPAVSQPLQPSGGLNSQPSQSPQNQTKFGHQQINQGQHQPQTAEQHQSQPITGATANQHNIQPSGHNMSLPPQTQFPPAGSKEGVRNWLQNQNGRCLLLKVLNKKHSKSLVIAHVGIC